MSLSFTSLLFDYILNRYFLQRNRWYSFGGTLKFLSEASPESFLDVLEYKIKENDKSINSLFLENGEFNGCPYANLLWALETISWKLDYLPRVSRALCRLSEFDNGGIYSNKPLNSLKEIYLGWINNTCATHVQRLQIIDSTLIKFYPKVAWNLLISLLPDDIGFTSYINKPKYRDWAESVENKVLLKDYNQYIEGVVDRLLCLLSIDQESRWPDLIENISKLPRKQLNEVVEKLISIEKNELSIEERLEIGNKLRFIISTHREFEHQEWALSKDIINKLEDSYYLIVPDIPLLKNKYLFDEYYPNLINPVVRSETDFDECNEMIATVRRNALLEIYLTDGIDGIKQFVINCNNPDLIGKTIANSELGDILKSELLNWLEGDGSLVVASQCFVFSCAIIDRKWVKEVLNQSENWSEDKIVNFLVGLPFDQDTFDIISNLKDKIIYKYWKKIKSYNLADKDLGNINWVIEQLLLTERPLAALKVTSRITCASYPKVYLDCNLLIDVLKNVAFNPTDYEIKTDNRVQEQILKAIEYIQKQKQLPKEDIMQIEWIYLPVLRFNSVKPINLEKEILENPEFFLQVLSFVIRDDRDDKNNEDSVKELEKNRAQNTFILLNLISKIPGQKEDCSVDAKKLRDWVYKTREYLKPLGSVDFSDYYIGKILANSPLGTDGIWPHESVRDLIEELQNTDIESALTTEKQNSGEVTVRLMLEGGAQERKHAEKYCNQADKIKLKWPRTSEILRRLRNSYEYGAYRQDSEVKLIE